jgi:Ras-related protein Rab-7A
MSVVKLVVVGDSNVGKTSVIQQFVNKRFTSDFKSTIGSDFASKQVSVDGQTINLQIWDTAGQERYRSLSTSYFKGCEAAFVVFDVTKEASFDHVSFWVDEVVRSCNLSPTDFEGKTPFPVFVVGNKSDLEASRTVQKKRAADEAKANGWQYLECSAKYGDNVDQLFKACAVSVVDRRSAAPPAVSKPTTVVPGPTPAGKKQGGLCGPCSAI